VQFLVANDADVHAQDADGWTPLHNACSKVRNCILVLITYAYFEKGYLDIVRWLCEEGAAAALVDGVSGIDVRSKGGWTPLSTFGCHMCYSNTEYCLVNAASKGHLPVVRYLLTKQSANPLVRNNWGETAYDASAAVFEVWICEVSVDFDFLLVAAGEQFPSGSFKVRGRTMAAVSSPIRSVGCAYYCSHYIVRKSTVGYAVEDSGRFWRAAKVFGVWIRETRASVSIRIEAAQTR
jgi:hypothetical protein